MALVAAVWLAAIGSGCSDETILMPAGEGNPVKVLASIDRFCGILTESGSKTIAADNSYDRSTFVNSDKIRITKKYGGVADNVIEYTLSSGIWTPPSGKALPCRRELLIRLYIRQIHQHSIFHKALRPII